uniref:Uncharacterized protein n=2 Tax=Bionectria ochroleuca TaxID=29856 RepID=A0A0B7K864_BIOOC
MGPYYDTIRNPSSFARHASDAENFETLLMNTADTGASNWGTNHLFALRVLCSEPTSQLKLLQPYYPASSSGFEPCIISLIDGYQGVNLAQLQEPQIIRRFQPNRLGYAALAHLLRSEEVDDHPAAERTQRPSNPSQRDPGMMDWEGIQIGSSSPTGPGSSSEPGSSIGYTEAPSAPILEDHFRDVRQTYKFKHSDVVLQATDDGGIQILTRRGPIQVAMMEGKRTFQTTRGTPVVTDGILTQLIGELITYKMMSGVQSVSKDDFVIILAIRHYINFSTLTSQTPLLRALLLISNQAPESFMRIDSTAWFDIKSNARRAIVMNILALVDWADAQQ